MLVLTVLALLLAACGNDAAEETAAPPDTEDADTEDTENADTENADSEDSDSDSDEPVTLTVWGWAGDFDKNAAAYMEENPHVTIEVVNAGIGGESYEKLRNAISAGSGVPDIMMMSGSALGSFVAQDALVDMRDFGGEDYLANQTDFVAARSQVGDGIYGYSMGWGPLVYWYNQSVFEENGLTVPTTWEEFRENSETFRAANPDSYMSNFPYLDTAWAGVLWQAGQRPFSWDDGAEVAIEWDGPQTQMVAEYWQGMLDDDIVARVPDFTADWSQGIAQGLFASFIGGSWYTGVIAGSAPDQSGEWRVAALPNWAGSDPATADAAFAVMTLPKLGENHEEAAAFVNWATNTDEGVQLSRELQGAFPSYKPVLESPEFVDEGTSWDEFFGGQSLLEEFVAASETIDTSYQFGPFYDYALSLQYEAIGAAFEDQVPLPEGMSDMQDELVQYANDQGYTVVEGN